MYLHGGSLRGDTLDKPRQMGLPHELEKQPDFPFVVVSPQCPKGEIRTDSQRLMAILDEVVKPYRIDTSRIYLSEHSMGGRGTLYLAYKHPERFAAIGVADTLRTVRRSGKSAT